MATLIRDPVLEERIVAERAANGGDRYDEVWAGIYIMSPMPNDEHQMLVGKLTRVLDEVIGDHGLGQVRPGVNVSDRVEGWQENYRVPDVAVFLQETRATNHDTFWHGGPDFAIEIVSSGDQTRDKLPFYAATGTQELLIVDRDPWQLELYRRSGDVLESIGIATTSNNATVVCETVSLGFQLIEGSERPRIRIAQRPNEDEWTI